MKPKSSCKAPAKVKAKETKGPRFASLFHLGHNFSETPDIHVMSERPERPKMASRDFNRAMRVAI